jgi:transposase-like protein
LVGLEGHWKYNLTFFQLEESNIVEMINTEKFIENLHKEINRRNVRKNRILNTIYLVGVFIFDFMLDTGEWI